jgi:hypothetical protein
MSHELLIKQNFYSGISIIDIWMIQNSICILIERGLNLVVMKNMNELFRDMQWKWSDLVSYTEYNYIN